MMQGVNIILEENAKLRMALTAMTKAHDTLADQVALDTARIITVVQQLTEAQQEIARLRAERDSAIDSFNAAIGRETQLMNQLTAMTERDRVRHEDYQRACGMIAAMHRAAMGVTCGPSRGVVEDVEDLRTAFTAGQQEITRLKDTQGYNEQFAQHLAEQDQEIIGLRAELDNYRSLAEKAGATLAVSALAAMTQERDVAQRRITEMETLNAGLRHTNSAFTINWDRLRDQLQAKVDTSQQQLTVAQAKIDQLNTQFAAMTQDRDLWRLEASAMADDNTRLTEVYQAGLRTWEPVYRVQSEKLLQAQQELIQLRQNAQHDHAVIASLYEELTDLSARPDTRS